MRWTLIGLIIIGLGVLALVFRGVPYKDQEKVIDIGPFHASAVQDKTIDIPPVVGAGIVAAGAAVLVLMGRRR